MSKFKDFEQKYAGELNNFEKLPNEVIEKYKGKVQTH